jgi:hypothetical protein
MTGYNEKKLRRALANIDARLTKIEAGMRSDASRRSVSKSQVINEKPTVKRQSGANLLLAALDAHRAGSLT